MNLHFTKMQGAGNDFVVLDGTSQPIDLSADQYRKLGDRRFGVGADQILIVEKSATEGIDFAYASSTTAATRWSSAATAHAASCATWSTKA